MDIFSFAMLLFELFTGQVPFERLDIFKTNNAIRKGNRPSLNDSNLEPAFPAMVELMMDCWQQSPSDRPTAQEVCVETLCYNSIITLGHYELLDEIVKTLYCMYAK